MNMINVGFENSSPINLHYEDIGSGKPIILIHGWPLNHQSWEKQIPDLVANGYRVITYCRRGFGHSSKPSVGYEYDTFAEDLHKLITHLNLHNITLVGFSMGTGEVARYISTYGSEKVSRAVFISGILPALLKSDENPEGVDESVFEGMIEKCQDDRLQFLRGFLDDFYSHGMLNRSTVSEAVRDFSWSIAAQASPIATLRCIGSWLEDFRQDIKKIEVPSLVIHGSGDKITPIKNTGERLHKLLPSCQYVEIEGAPHGLIVSHADEVNAILLDFLSSSTQRLEPAPLQH